MSEEKEAKVVTLPLHFDHSQHNILMGRSSIGKSYFIEKQKEMLTAKGYVCVATKDEKHLYAFSKEDAPRVEKNLELLFLKLLAKNCIKRYTESFVLTDIELLYELTLFDFELSVDKATAAILETKMATRVANGFVFKERFFTKLLDDNVEHELENNIKNFFYYED